LIGATNEKPRLRQQPGFSCVRLRNSSYQILWRLNAPAAMIFKANTACGDDAIPSYRLVLKFLRF